MPQPYVSFNYMNHRGEIARRHVIIDAIEYITDPGYGYADGWFLSGICQTKGERRSFAFANIIQPAGSKSKVSVLTRFSPEV
jgi:hypothetical protein